MAAKTRQRMPAEDRRAQLVDEATLLISRVGYRRFTIAELARECGITRAGVLHHFASAEDVLLEVLRKRDENDARAVLADVSAHGGDTRRIFDLVIRRNLSQPEIVRLYTVLSAESLDPDHPAHFYFAERYEQTITMMAERLDGFGRPARELAIEIHSFMDGLQLGWLRDPAIDFERQWAAFADGVLPRGR